MPGQGLIVATGAIEYPAEFSAMSPEALSQLAISKVVTFTSTYDHRIIQGADSGLFLARIEELLLGQHDFYEEVLADIGVPYKPYHWATDRTSGLFSGSRTTPRNSATRSSSLKIPGRFSSLLTLAWFGSIDSRQASA